jgi:LemA protein
MKKVAIVLLVIVVLAGVAGAWLIGARNKLVVANENVTASWAQVDNVLQRRADLIPNLVATVKGYAKQEKDVFTQIAEARSKLAGARTIPEKIDANKQVDSALSRLLVIVERYPELKSNQNFMALQDELAGTENRIAVERMRYNESVRSYNLLVQQFPSGLAATLFHFEKKDAYFQPTEGARAAPKVDF